jgi:predicted fused transcriptional regulator/phosphomethylpyrimidine kinase
MRKAILKTVNGDVHIMNGPALLALYKKHGNKLFTTDIILDIKDDDGKIMAMLNAKYVVSVVFDNK